MRRAALAVVAFLMMGGACAVAPSPARAQMSREEIDLNLCLSGWNTTITYDGDKREFNVWNWCDDMGGYGYGGPAPLVGTVGPY